MNHRTEHINILLAVLYYGFTINKPKSAKGKRAWGGILRPISGCKILFQYSHIGSAQFLQG
jgi:hypothetical protein